MDALATHLYASVQNHREIRIRIKHRIHLSNQLSPVVAVSSPLVLLWCPKIFMNFFQLLDVTILSPILEFAPCHKPVLVYQCLMLPPTSLATSALWRHFGDSEQKYTGIGHCRCWLLHHLYESLHQQELKISLCVNLMRISFIIR